MTLCPDRPGTHGNIWLPKGLKATLYIPPHDSNKLTWYHQHLFSRAPSQLVLILLWIEEWTEKSPPVLTHLPQTLEL